jgi:hypothetical protein
MTLVRAIDPDSPAMTKIDFMKLMSFPEAWDSMGMYPDELFEGQLSGYQPGDEDASEHDRNGAFHWWLRRNPTRDRLERLLKLSVLDPDAHLGADVRRYIRKAPAFDAQLLKLEAELLNTVSSLHHE